MIEPLQRSSMGEEEVKTEEAGYYQNPAVTEGSDNLQDIDENQAHHPSNNNVE